MWGESMEIYEIFSQFGYPALVTGALMWLLVNVLGKLESTIDKMDETIQTNTNAMIEIKTILNFITGKGEEDD